MNLKRAIIAGGLVWILVILFYSASYSFHFIPNAELQANIVLCLALIPCARIGARYYYKNGDCANGFMLGAAMVIVAMILDGLITVPVFVVPKGGSHFTFFVDPGFWVIVVEYLVIVVVYSIVRKGPDTQFAKSKI